MTQQTHANGLPEDDRTPYEPSHFPDFFDAEAFLAARDNLQEIGEQLDSDPTIEDVSNWAAEHPQFPNYSVGPTAAYGGYQYPQYPQPPQVPQLPQFNRPEFVNPMAMMLQQQQEAMAQMQFQAQQHQLMSTMRLNASASAHQRALRMLGPMYNYQEVESVANDPEQLERYLSFEMRLAEAGRQGRLSVLNRRLEDDPEFGNASSKNIMDLM